MNDYEALIDRPRIDAAKAKLDDVTARLGPAATRFFASQTAAVAAQKAHQDALSGDSGADPFVTGDALEAARKLVDIAIDSEAAIQAAIERTAVEMEHETGLAHQLLADDAVAKIITAATVYDDLVARQEAAVQDFRQAVRQLSHARANHAHGASPNAVSVGSPSRTKPGNDAWQMPTRQEVIARLAGPFGRHAGVNPDGSFKS